MAGAWRARFALISLGGGLALFFCSACTAMPDPLPLVPDAGAPIGLDDAGQGRDDQKQDASVTDAAHLGDLPPSSDAGESGDSGPPFADGWPSDSAPDSDGAPPPGDSAPESDGLLDGQPAQDGAFDEDYAVDDGLLALD